MHWKSHVKAVLCVTHTLIRHEQCFGASSSRPPLDWFWPWVEEHHRSFAAVIKDGLWRSDDLHCHAQVNLPNRLNRVHGNLLFMAKKVFVFLPTAADPLQGWSDFWLFASHFNRLPDHIKKELRPFHLVIKAVP